MDPFEPETEPVCPVAAGGWKGLNTVNKKKMER